MLTRTNVDGTRTALFSNCERYRYELLIRWNSGPLLVMTALNPSTASHLVSDSTVTRQCERAAKLGFGAFMMLNAFAIRATDPKVMLKADDPYGDWRDPSHLVESYRRHNGSMLIAAWGAHAKHLGRHEELLAAFRGAGIPLHHLAKTSAGFPGHPLYLSYDVQPTLF